MFAIQIFDVIDFPLTLAEFFFLYVVVFFLLPSLKKTFGDDQLDLVEN